MTGLPQSDCSLGALPKGACGVVLSVRSSGGANDHELERRLWEFFFGGASLGFLDPSVPALLLSLARLGSPPFDLLRPATAPRNGGLRLAPPSRAAPPFGW